MIGAIIGDIVGSIYEFRNHRSKDFPLFSKGCFATDDSIMSLAIAKALLDCKGDYSQLNQKAIKKMQEIGRPYPYCGFGGSFYHWIYSDNPLPYGSYGNGAAMRIGAVGFVAQDIEQAKTLSYGVTAVTHNHPEGLKGAESVAVAMVLARQGWNINRIRQYIEANYYKINFTIDGIRKTYRFNETCQDTVPQAFAAFFESKNFEDALRNAISVGGDSDTLAAITCAMAEAYYGVPYRIAQEGEKYLDNRLKSILEDFEKVFGRVCEYGWLTDCLREGEDVRREELASAMERYYDYNYFDTLKKYGLKEALVEKFEEIKVENATTELLLAVLTFLFRAEHFGSTGACQRLIDNGCIAKWLRRIARNEKTQTI